jgi:hypothetical protein
MFSYYIYLVLYFRFSQHSSTCRYIRQFEVIRQLRLGLDFNFISGTKKELEIMAKKAITDCAKEFLAKALDVLKQFRNKRETSTNRNISMSVYIEYGNDMSEYDNDQIIEVATAQILDIDFRKDTIYDGSFQQTWQKFTSTYGVEVSDEGTNAITDSTEDLPPVTSNMFEEITIEFKHKRV